MSSPNNLSIMAAEREQLLADKATLRSALVLARETILKRTTIRRDETPLKEINEALDTVHPD